MKLFLPAVLFSALLLEGVNAKAVKGDKTLRGLQEEGDATSFFYKHSRDDDDVVSEQTLRVTNLAFRQPFSPFFVMSHSGEVEPLFTLGEPASHVLALLAETGDPQHLVNYYAGRPGVWYAGMHSEGAPYEGGESTNITIPVTEEYDRVTIASMAVNTNDCFVALNGAQLDVGEMVRGVGYDAGSEENNEDCDSVPGPACPADSGNEDSFNGEGFVHVHRGITGIGDLTLEPYQWLNPMMSVLVLSEEEADDKSGSGSKDDDDDGVCVSDLNKRAQPYFQYLDETHVSQGDYVCQNRTLMAGLYEYFEHVRHLTVTEYEGEADDFDECEFVKLLLSRDESLAPAGMSRGLKERPPLHRELKGVSRRRLSDAFDENCISAAAEIFEELIWIMLDIIVDPPSSAKEALGTDLVTLVRQSPNAVNCMVDTWSQSCEVEYPNDSEATCNANRAWKTFGDACSIFGVSAIVEAITNGMSWWQVIATIADFIASIGAALASGGASIVVKAIILLDDLVDLIEDVANMITECS